MRKFIFIVTILIVMPVYAAKIVGYISSFNGKGSDFVLKRNEKMLEIRIYMNLKIGDEITALKKGSSITLILINDDTVTLMYEDTKDRVYQVKENYRSKWFNLLVTWFDSLWLKNPEDYERIVNYSSR